MEGSGARLALGIIVVVLVAGAAWALLTSPGYALASILGGLVLWEVVRRSGRRRLRFVRIERPRPPSKARPPSNARPPSAGRPPGVVRPGSATVPGSASRPGSVLRTSSGAPSSVPMRRSPVPALAPRRPLWNRPPEAGRPARPVARPASTAPRRPPAPGGRRAPRPSPRWP
jgi:hypothetical protein